MTTPDVTVMGAGIFGLSVAWECQCRGARVRVIDPAGPGAGASGGVVGALAPHVPEPWNALKAFQLECLLAAADFWAAVEAAGGGNAGYGRTGRIQPLDGDAAVARARARCNAAAENWGGTARWQVRPAEALGPWAPPSPSGWVVVDDLTARIDPNAAVLALVRALEAGGAEIVRDGEAAGAVVWATGWRGLEALGAALARPVGGGVKGQAAVLDFDAGAEAPQIFADGLLIVPHARGVVAVGSTSERDFDPATAEATDGQLEAVIARARTAMPALAAAPVIQRWAGVRPRAVSRAPIMGPWPGRPGHYIANGGFRIGVALGPGVGRLMAALILDETDTIPGEFRVETLLGAAPRRA